MKNVDREARYGAAVRIVELCREVAFREIGIAADRVDPLAR